MATAHYQNKLIITMSPKELRDLADKMEKRWTELRAGQECFVDILHYSTGGSDPMVVLYLDQQYFHDLEAAKRKKSSDG